MPRAGAIAWHAATRKQWRELTTAPFTAMWLESDWLLAYRWLALQNRAKHVLEDADASASMLKTLLTEVRAVEGSLGIDPKSRAALRWQYSPDTRRGLASVSALEPGRSYSRREIDAWASAAGESR